MISKSRYANGRSLSSVCEIVHDGERWDWSYVIIGEESFWIKLFIISMWSTILWVRMLLRMEKGFNSSLAVPLLMQRYEFKKKKKKLLIITLHPISFHQVFINSHLVLSLWRSILSSITNLCFYFNIQQHKQSQDGSPLPCISLHSSQFPLVPIHHRPLFFITIWHLDRTLSIWPREGQGRRQDFVFTLCRFQE